MQKNAIRVANSQTCICKHRYRYHLEYIWTHEMYVKISYLKCCADNFLNGREVVFPEKLQLLLHRQNIITSDRSNQCWYLQTTNLLHYIIQCKQFTHSHATVVNCAMFKITSKHWAPSCNKS